MEEIDFRMSCPQGIKRDSCEKVLWQWEVPVAYVTAAEFWGPADFSLADVSLCLCKREFVHSPPILKLVNISIWRWVGTCWSVELHYLLGDCEAGFSCRPLPTTVGKQNKAHL